jgi:SAM-dependent methyltransferase
MAASKKPIDAAGYDTDKAAHTHYLRNYEEHFKHLVGRDVRLLELGVYRGGSLLLWRDYFERGLIVGLDLNPLELDDPTGRIRVYQGEQQDTALLDRVARENAPEGFDIVIDDCSHQGALTRASFWHLFEHHLKPGGLYVVEDWGTGYWDAWPDGALYRPPRRARGRLRTRIGRALIRLQAGPAGRLPFARPLASRLKRVVLSGQFRSHEFGMVGFVKELVDELGMADITHPAHGTGPQRASKIREMRLSPSHLFVVKA